MSKIDAEIAITYAEVLLPQWKEIQDAVAQLIATLIESKT